jgi:hypothetical protein
MSFGIDTHTHSKSLARFSVPWNGLAELACVSPWPFIPLLQCCPMSPTLIASKSA